MTKGMLIAIEGTDGVGKATQAAILASRLRSIGHHTASISFPRYDTPTGRIVKRYLNGDFGVATAIDPRKASRFYADDRLAAAPEILAWLDEGKTIVSDRYSLANKAHQGSKIDDTDDRMRFYAWLDELEYGKNRIPKPDLVLILHVPAAIGLGRSERRAVARGTTTDGHENLDHLIKAERTYLELAALSPEDHLVVSCVRDGVPLDADAVGELVWSTVTGFLADR